MEKLGSSIRVPGSFRDPSGFLFWQNGILYRQVNVNYKENYDHLISSELYQALVKDALLIPHEEATATLSPRPDLVYRIIKPEPISFISYPYEWCFSQLKDSALAMLRIQKISLDFGMSLKDCSAYNIQFRNGRPLLIDTLSFEKYREGQPWVAYRQFCQHFLAPLALMRYKDVRLNQLLRVYIDGIPLDLASSLLTFRTRLFFSLLSHIHLHARSQKRFADHILGKSGHIYKMGRRSLLGLIDSLESAVNKLQWQPRNTEWSDYYEDTNYSPEAVRHKKEIVASFLEKVKPRNLWDFGANVGLFSRLASDRGIGTVCFDIDAAAVEKNYLDCKKRREVNILPLLLDLTNPSPGIGWENGERMSLVERGPADTLLALALIHHLAISNNVPLNRIASFFKHICNWLLVEFVPKSDSQVQRLLATREDIFPDYTRQAFVHEFAKLFNIEDYVKIRDSERTLYLMRGIRG